MIQVTKVWWDGQKLMAEPIDPTTIYQEPLQREPDFWEGYQPEPTKPAPVREDWGPGPHEVHSLPPAAPVQEPYGYWWIPDGSVSGLKPGMSPNTGPHPNFTVIPLYTTPPAAKRQWVGLTDEERGQAINANFGTGLWHMAKDIEAKLKEKNT
jgi:hypothetical protein